MVAAFETAFCTVPSQAFTAECSVDMRQEGSVVALPNVCTPQHANVLRLVIASPKIVVRKIISPHFLEVA